MARGSLSNLHLYPQTRGILEREEQKASLYGRNRIPTKWVLERVVMDYRLGNGAHR